MTEKTRICEGGNKLAGQAAVSSMRQIWFAGDGTHTFCVLSFGKWLEVS